jgi:MFS family permease
MWIDFWATLLSGAEALIPAFAVILGLGAQGYGILAASTGFGALVAAAALSFLPTIHNQGRWVVAMIGAFGLFTICFGLSNSLITASLSLAAVGAADMISTVMRQTIRQLATPDAMRGRMSATSSLFHISGPQLGDFEAGVVAHGMGERFSIVLGGVLCVGVAGLWSRAKALVNYQHQQSD